VGKQYEQINPDLRAWIEGQHVFFVATAPLAASGHVNCSPKGLDSLRIVDEHRVAFLDLTGSGAETIAHVRENGRIVLMFCAFEGPPRIVRLHGAAEVIPHTSPDWPQWSGLFPEHPGPRAVILIRTTRVSDSCGFSVPLMEYQGERDVLQRWIERNGVEHLPAYRREKNARSIDGLPAADFD